MDDLPQSLLDAVQYFSDPDVCTALMRRIKWPDGKPMCPHCGGNRLADRKGREKLRCKDCRKETSYKVGTIMEDSPLKLTKWFVAIWMVANCKNGISSHEMARALGVSQKSAWFMEHRIRAAMKTGTFQKLRGEVESDETFVGGESRNMHPRKRERKIRGRGAVGKTPVHGLLQRGDKAASKPSQVQASVVGNVEGNTLLPIIRRWVERGAIVYTDSASGYGELCFTHVHQAVNHVDQYVRGRVHTNGLENFWALLKRAIKGTYVAVAPFHLGRYVDEEVFRFNQRLRSDAGRFADAMTGVVGRRLTWRQLTAQGDAGFMGIK